MNFNNFGIEVNVYYNYASSLPGWYQGVRNKFKIARGPWISQLYSSLPIYFICQNIKHIAIPVGHLCFSGDIITNFRGFCIFFSELQLPSYSIRNFIFFNSFLVYRVSVLLYHACILCNRALILSIVRESYQVYRSIWGVFPIYTIVLILSYL